MDNTSFGRGGAIYTQGDLSITGASFFENTSQSIQGGGALLLAAPRNVEIRQSVFADNRSLNNAPGGAIRSVAGLMLENITFSQNEAGGNGGAIKVSGSALSEFRFVTFSQNQTSESGASFYSDNRQCMKATSPRGA